MLHRKSVHIEQHTDDIVFHQHIRFFFGSNDLMKISGN